MDSPLLPNIRHTHGEPSHNLLADLSLASPDPDSRRAHHPHSQPLLESSTANIKPPLIPNGSHGELKAKARFSLFAPNVEPKINGHHWPADDDDDADAEERPADDEDVTVHPSAPRSSAERDERLRESLYELRRMNEVFDGFLNALDLARGHNEVGRGWVMRLGRAHEQRLAARVSQTSTLLDQYTALLGQTEHTKRLLMNPAWTGADDVSAVSYTSAQHHSDQQDAAALEAEESARRAADETVAAEQRRQVSFAQSTPAQKGGSSTSRSGASRGRGTARGGVPPRGRGGMSIGATTAPRQSMLKPPSSGFRKSMAAAGSGTATAGLGGKYANVQSSGYGGSGQRRAT